MVQCRAVVSVLIKSSMCDAACLHGDEQHRREKTSMFFRGRGVSCGKLTLAISHSLV